MGSRYVEVPASALRERFAGAGFVLAPGVGEEVYERVYEKDPRFVIRIFSSLSRGDAESARGCGEDAIRVVAVFRPDPGDLRRGVGIWKGPRVYRTGSVEKVLDRTIERARDAYRAIKSHIFSRGVPSRNPRVA